MEDPWKIPLKSDSKKFAEMVQRVAKAQKEETALIHIPSEKQLKPTHGLLEDLSVIPGDIEDFADSIESRVQFYNRELSALREIHNRIKKAGDVSAVKKDVDLQTDGVQDEEVKESIEKIDQEDIVSSGSHMVLEEEPIIPVEKKALLQGAIDLRRQIIITFLQRKIFDVEPPREIMGLLNYFVDNENVDALEFINDCVAKTEPETLVFQLTRIYEIFELSESLNKEIIGDPEKKTQGLWSFNGVDLLHFVEANEVTSNGGAIIDWEGLSEVVELKLEEDPVSNTTTTKSSSETALAVASSEKSELSRLVGDLKNNELDDSDRSDCYEIEKILNTMHSSANSVVVVRPGEGVFAQIGDGHWQRMLVDPETGEILSGKYKDICITPFGGLIKVTKDLEGGHTGQGYIDYRGRVVVEPQPGSRVDRYHNGSDLVFDRRKIVNIKTGRILHEAEGGEDINIFGNLLEITSQDRKGLKISHNRKFLKSNGEDLGLGDIEEMRDILAEVVEIPYRNLEGRSESTNICTRVSVKIHGKYSLVNALDGSVILEPKYKNIKRFFGGEKLGKKEVKKPVLHPITGNIIGYDNLSLTIPIEYVLVEDENGKFTLLDQNGGNILNGEFENEKDLGEAFDIKFPHNSRKILRFPF